MLTNAHDTLLKFGHPKTCIKEYDHWAVCLRPKQVTLGSLVMISTSSDTAYSDLSVKAFAEQQKVVTDIETVLREFTDYEKINYLMLMMVDPQVHNHVIPRYNGLREFDGVKFPDNGWPGPPDLSKTADCSATTMQKLHSEISSLWSS